MSTLENKRAQNRILQKRGQNCFLIGLISSQTPSMAFGIGLDKAQYFHANCCVHDLKRGFR